MLWKSTNSAPELPLFFREGLLPRLAVESGQVEFKLEFKWL